jgi:phage terminase Nu1 subunit (DNA packaging protein)
MRNDVNPQSRAVLTSWKEIASYFGKGVRTVQRWERQFGMPVRRPNQKTKGVVCATCSELDRWLTENWSQRQPEKPEVPAPRETDALAAAIEQ